MRAVVLTLDDEVAGIIGLSREHRHGLFFSDMKPELEPYLKTIPVMRALKAAMKFVTDYPAWVFAIAEHDKGCQILEWLGFVNIDEDIYQWQTQ